MFSKSVQRISSSARMTKRFSSGSEGATAASGAFGQKEKAVENQWARSHVSTIEKSFWKQRKRGKEKEYSFFF